MKRTIDQLVKDCLMDDASVNENVKKHSTKIDINNLAGSLWYTNEIIAINDIIHARCEASKSRLSLCGLLDCFQTEYFNARILDYGLNHISYALLSDHEHLITTYAALRYQRGRNAELSMDEMVGLGESPIWCNTVQHFMVGHMEGVEKNLNILETLTLPHLARDEQGLIDDYQFYQALYARDKGKLEEILDKLVSPAIHQRRNESPLLKQYLSHPAVGYAKLAWRLGLQVEVKSPLVPSTLLPVRPNDEYPIRYDFLKEVIL